MTDPQLERALRSTKNEVETGLRQLLRAERGAPERLRRAMGHSLFGGGKLLRPALVLWSREAFRQDRRCRPRSTLQQAKVVACAVEMIHTYSLIHDDLPAMDDDVLRRGRPTCHVAFDEATAILAGDGLQALAFGLLARCGREGAFLTEMFAAAIGPRGMVGGQMDDLLGERGAVTASLVRRIHVRKTALLIAACLASGAWLGGAGRGRVDEVQKAGRLLGLAFQGADDLLDVMASTEQLGKTAGKDVAADKATWVRLEGVAKARERTSRYGRGGWRRLRDVLPSGEATDRLLALVTLMWKRDR